MNYIVECVCKNKAGVITRIGGYTPHPLVTKLAFNYKLSEVISKIERGSVFVIVDKKGKEIPIVVNNKWINDLDKLPICSEGC